MITFNVGDIVVDNSGNYVGVVCTDGDDHEGTYAWEVYWNDGDTTYYEDSESMSHHKIEAFQWSIRLYKKYLDIICP